LPFFQEWQHNAVMTKIICPSPRLRLVLYVRVSTASQLDGYGLETQERDGLDWAKRNSHKVVLVCRDAAVSGTVDALDREGLSSALGAIRNRTADGILAPSLSRIGRTLTVQEAALALVWQDGGRVFTVESGEVLPDDDDDPMRRACRQMMGVFHDLDRSMIARRLRHGRDTKATNGGYAGGAPRFGTRAEGRALAAEPVELEILGRIRSWRAAGHSLRQIAALLDAEGATTKRGGIWHPSTLARLLDAPVRDRHNARSAGARNRAQEARRVAEASRLASAAGVRRA
jgi:DNA invertase Pin-like site-specific DNA recombinase